MLTRSASIQRLPIRLVLGYFAATLFVFVYGPFDWPIDNWASLLGFLAATMLALWLGFRWTVARTAAETSFVGWRRVIILGAIASFIILFVAAPVYTGKMPWQVLDALRDPGAAYHDFQDQLELTAGERGPIALARILTWPLVFAVLPLGILHWSEMRIWLRILMLATIAAIVVSSILRGTDREIADLMAVTGGTGLVLFARKSAHEGLTLRALLRRYLVLIVAGIVMLGIAASLFAQRKADRYVTFAICLSGNENIPTEICADFDHPWFGLLDEPQRFSASMAAAYFAEGYYGLALALSLDGFRSTWGLGNAPFAMAAYVSLTGDDELYKRSYTYRLRDVWSDEHRYDTMFPWIANDISFPMVPIFMLLIGSIFGASWRDAVFGRNDCAAVVFMFFLIMMGYLPANNQITLVPDHLFALLAWICFWRCTPRRVAEPRTSFTDKHA
jgi:hypothetical protein